MNAAITAWILAATMGVSLTVPGLALFYGGMIGARSILNVVMMTFGAVAVTAFAWTLVGYSAVLGPRRAPQPAVGGSQRRSRHPTNCRADEPPPVADRR